MTTTKNYTVFGDWFSIAAGFRAKAIVRNRQTSEYDAPRLHLEFINENFPIEQLKLPSENDVPDEHSGVRS